MKAYAFFRGERPFPGELEVADLLERLEEAVAQKQFTPGWDGASGEFFEGKPLTATHLERHNVLTGYREFLQDVPRGRELLEAGEDLSFESIPDEGESGD